MGMRSNPDNELANMIRAEFRASGWSIKRLAEESRVPYASCHGFATGTRDVATGVASRLCKALGLRIVADTRRKQR